MSESSFPFGGPEEPGPTDTPEEPGRRSPVVLVGALVGALVLGGGGFFLLGGSGDTQDAVVAAPVKRAAPAAEAPAPAPAAAAVPAASSEQVGRNPFKALYVETPVAPAGISSTTTSTATSSGTTTTGGTTTGTTSGTTGGTGTVTEIKTLTVELVRVDEATANADFVVTKSGEKTPVAGVQPGHDFGSYFRYIGWGWSDELAGKRVQCARVLIGDALVDICQQDVHEVKTS